MFFFTLAGCVGETEAEAMVLGRAGGGGDLDALLERPACRS